MNNTLKREQTLDTENAISYIIVKEVGGMKAYRKPR
jgi:hypothetical protein